MDDDTVAESEQHSPAQRRRRSRVRWLVAAVVGVVVVWLGLAAVQLVAAADDTRSGVDEVESLRELSAGDLDVFVDSIGDESAEHPDGTTDPDGTTAERLRSARDSFDAAAQRVDSPLMAPLRLLPVLGRQIRSVDALTGAASTLTGATADALDQLAEVSERGAATPEERLEAAAATATIIEGLSASLETVDLGPSEALLGPLADARAQFADEHDRLRTTVQDAAVAVRGVSDFLEGPSDYLVLAANNSEMRAGSGMPLQVGQLHVEQGRMELGEFVPTAELVLAEPGAVSDPDVQALWGWLLPTQEWRNLNATPRFDQTARMAAEMWSASGRGEVDGVMSVDVVGVQLLLEASGPVTVPGTEEDPDVTEVSADSVLRDLLLDQYAGYGSSDDFTDERRDRLGRVAAATFDAVNSRPISASEFIRVLERSGAGRHMMFWSSVPEQQAAWVALGASGSLPEDALLLSVLNRQGNKLDQFLRVDADLDATTSGDTRRVVVTATLRNETPTGLSQYVAGPNPRAKVAEGEYGGILTLSMPAGAGAVRVSGAPTVLAGDDGPNRVVGAEVRVARGASLRVVVEFDLPIEWTEVEVQPSARVPPVQWTAGDLTWTEARPVRIELDDLG